MENTVASKYNPNYKMHVLVKYECLECERSFILSKKQVDDLEGFDVSCPYCGNYNVEDTVIMDDPDSLEELGCMAISHVEKENKLIKIEYISISGIGVIDNSQIERWDITREVFSNIVDISINLNDGTYIRTSNKRTIQIGLTNGEVMNVEKYFLKKQNK